MARKVKCQHCWKTFEVPDQQVNTQRPCVFCQHMTTTVPIESEEKTTQQPAISDSFAILEYGLIGLLVLLVIQALLLGVALGRSESYDREALASRQQEQIAALQKIAQRIGKCQEMLKKSEDSLVPPDKTVKGLVGAMKPSIQLIWDRLGQLQTELDKWKEQLNKTEAEKNKAAEK